MRNQKVPIGIGGSSVEAELSRLSAISVATDPLPRDAFERRIEKARSLMASLHFDAIYISAGSNLYYFTGTRWHPSERMVGAIISSTGAINYIVPAFETETFSQHMLVEGERHRKVWNAEKEAQATAFAAAQIGVRCGDVDIAAREFLESRGYGPDYAVPGLPHRTGHGIGLDVHEWPYLVRSDDTILDVGMCFSNEPMLCLYGEFGVRLEDHFYMTDQGPKWFTNPSYSIDDPFGLGSD